MADLIERDALLLKQKAHADLFADSTVHDDIVRRDEATAVLAEIINAPAVNRWIPCSERLPEIDKDVLVYAVRKDGLGDAVTTITQYINHIWFGHRIDTEPYWKDQWQYFHSDYEITHWMPLPEPPKEDET